LNGAVDEIIETNGGRTDAPELRRRVAAEVELTAAMTELAQTQPTAATGIAAVLAYAREMRIDDEQLFSADADSPHSLAAWLLTLERAAAALTSA
jgi:hypothetical protein